MAQVHPPHTPSIDDTAFEEMFYDFPLHEGYPGIIDVQALCLCLN